MAVTLAHQHRAQFTDRTLAAIDANTASKVCFRLDGTDPSTMANLFGGQTLTALDFKTLPAYQAYAHLLVHGSHTPWVSLSTQPLPEPITDPVREHAVSHARYGVPSSDTERALIAIGSVPAITVHRATPSPHGTEDTATSAEQGHTTAAPPPRLGRRRIPPPKPEARTAPAADQPKGGTP